MTKNEVIKELKKEFPKDYVEQIMRVSGNFDWKYQDDKVLIEKDEDDGKYYIIWKEPSPNLVKKTYELRIESRVFVTVDVENDISEDRLLDAIEDELDKGYESDTLSIQIEREVDEDEHGICI